MTRHTIAYKLRKAVTNPRSVGPYVRRLISDARIRIGARDHPEYYRRVMDRMTKTNPYRAVGTETREEWLSVGRLQFDFLLAHGLKPEHKFLDIGCGNLRAGLLLIDYLHAGNYVGVDLSPSILIDGQKRLASEGLAPKVPYMYIVDGTDLSFLPEASFDVMHAHSVFSHVPENIVSTYIATSKRLLKPGGFFDFTFLESESEGSFLAEDFYYPATQIIDMTRRAGGEVTRMEGWSHHQTKFRLKFPS